MFCVFWDFYLCVVVVVFVCGFEKISLHGIRKGGFHGPNVALPIFPIFISQLLLEHMLGFRVFKNSQEAIFRTALVTTMLIISQTLESLDVLPVWGTYLKMTQQLNWTLKSIKVSHCWLSILSLGSLGMQSQFLTQWLAGNTESHSYCIILDTCVQLVTKFY